MTASYPHLFEPINLGPVRVKNRLMMTNHGGGSATPRGLRYIESRARGGVGLMNVPGLNTGVTHYSPAPGRYLDSAANEFDAVLPNPATPEGIAFFDDRVIPAFREIAAMGHKYGVTMISQIHHLGAAPTVAGLLPPIGPSPIRDEEAHSVPHVLEEEQIAELVLAYGHAARRGREAGLDAVELHAAHGYLIEQFLSPYTNKRTDRYGGSFENRLRFLREVIATVGKLAGTDFPVGLRINGDEFAEGGLSAADIAAIVKAVQDRLIYVNVSGGTTTGLKDGVSVAYVSPWLVPPGYNAPAAAVIKKAVSIPVIVTGRVFDPAQAERLIAEGGADMIGMGRGWLADPDWGAKAQAGRAEDIRPCIATNECHSEPRRGLRCTVNPEAGREDELEIVPAVTRKRVLVVGGGPAGLQAARTAALRGHDVVLCERDAALGGQARVMALDPTQAQLRSWLGYLERDARQAGVMIRLGTEVSAALVASEKYDAVVVATGATPDRPSIPGIDQPNVVTAGAVLDGSATAGPRVVVLGGLDDHLPPLTIADLLAQRGHDVEIVSEALQVGMAVERRTLHQLLKRLLEKDVRLTPLTKVTAVEGRRVRTKHLLTRRDGVVENVDTVVLSVGGRSVDGLARALGGSIATLQLVGDALAPRRIIHAVLEGARAGMGI